MYKIINGGFYKHESKKMVSTVLATVMMATSLCIPASAATYSVGLSRGVKHLAYVESDFTWATSYNRSHKRQEITNVDYFQKESGIMARKGGIRLYRSYSTKTKKVYACIANISVGIFAKYVSLGYSEDVEDDMTLYSNGEYNAKFNV